MRIKGHLQGRVSLTGLHDKAMFNAPVPDPSETKGNRWRREAAAQLPKRDLYRILSSLVILRPIAWITTVDGSGA